MKTPNLLAMPSSATAAGRAATASPHRPPSPRPLPLRGRGSGRPRGCPRRSARPCAARCRRRPGALRASSAAARRCRGACGRWRSRTGGTPSARASVSRCRRRASNSAVRRGLVDALGAARAGRAAAGARLPPSPRGAGARARSSGGRRSRAGRSPFITARPSSVSTTTGRSPPVKLTQPAATQRRSTARSHSSACSRRFPKVGTRVRPARSSRGPPHRESASPRCRARSARARARRRRAPCGR